MEPVEQVKGGKRRCGGPRDEAELRSKRRTHCVPASMLDGAIPDDDDVLAKHHGLMALEVTSGFEPL